MLQRTISGALFAVIMIGAILASKLVSQWFLFALAGIIAAGCIVELRKLTPLHWWWLAIPYIVVPMGLMCTFRTDQELLLAIITTVWVNDIFAYLVGIAVGRHKMLPKISPKKSWEGFFGGLIFATLYAWAIGHYLFGATGLWWVWIWSLIVVAAVIGDMFESWLKRIAGVKDSGTLIPGHGGLLDRFDSLLFALPVAWLYFWIISN